MIDVKREEQKVPKELVHLATFLSGKIEVHPAYHIMNLDGIIGNGHILYQKLEKGVRVIDISIRVHHDTAIPIPSLKSRTFQFLYCLQGDCTHLDQDGNELNVINPFQVTLLHYKNKFMDSMIVKQGKVLKMNIIQIDDQHCLTALQNSQDLHQDTIDDFLSNLELNPKFVHRGSYNIPIAEQLKKIYESTSEELSDPHNLTQQLSNKGRYYLILSIQIEQFFDDIDKSRNTSGLLQKELQRIIEISAAIKLKPQVPHTIKSLSMQTGLSPAKLQDGFRFLNGKTVLEFVRHQRLEKAEELIRTSELSISEIVYSIGFTSRSYFCKIFKKKYHFSPKEYQRKKK